MTASIWTDEVRVRSYDVTPRGTASVLALTDYFQEAAGRHAAALGVSMQDLLAENRAWVLAQFRLEIDRLPRWGETIVVETWPSGLERLFATREVVFRDEQGQEFACGTSRWFVIDTEHRRPSRPPSILYDMELPDRAPPLDAGEVSFRAPSRVEHERTFRVRYHDLDLNRHVNNVRYLEWALETLPRSILHERRCTGLALQFEAETTLDDSVRATAGPMDDADSRRIRHRLAHADTDRTLARAVTEWGPPSEDDASD